MTINILIMDNAEIYVKKGQQCNEFTNKLSLTRTRMRRVCKLKFASEIKSELLYIKR